LREIGGDIEGGGTFARPAFEVENGYFQHWLVHC
jgi:hypothetical protein